MNEFDQYVKHKPKARHYIRYSDDFVILSHDRTELERLLLKIGYFYTKNSAYNHIRTKYRFPHSHLEWIFWAGYTSRIITYCVRVRSGG